MRLRHSLLAFSLFGCCLAAHALEVVRDNQRYVVLGGTAAKIRDSLDRLGPIDPVSGQRWDAHTGWWLEWRFETRESRSGCDIAWVRTQLRVTQKLPQHGELSSLGEDLRRDWMSYLNRLGQHEEGHVRIPSDAAQRIEDSLRRLHADDCATLEREANRIGNEELNRARSEERAYDASTDHGRSQGARFPWTEGGIDQLTDIERAKLKDRRATLPGR
jgi:predicted secreted Zn-dependent protease